MKIEVFYRCSWCTWLVRVALSPQEWDRIGEKLAPTIEHHCHGEANRHGVAHLLGWKKVKDEEPEGEKKAEAEEGHEKRDGSKN